MSNRGKDFEAEFRKSLESLGLMVERIPDKIYWTGHRIASEESIADFFAFKSNDSFLALLIECKATATRRIDFSALQDHQEAALLNFEAFDPHMKGFVAVNFYDKVSLRRFNVCYMVPISVWEEYKEKIGRKSIPIKAFEEDERIIECPRCKGSIYDMSAWLKTL